MSPTPRYRGKPAASLWTVTGPDYEHRVPSEGAGVALALDKASRGEVGEVFVLRFDEEIVGRATKRDTHTEFQSK